MEYLISEYDCSTGETVVREMTEEERVAYDSLVSSGGSLGPS